MIFIDFVRVWVGNRKTALRTSPGYKDAQQNKKARAEKADMHSTVSQAFQEV